MSKRRFKEKSTDGVYHCISRIVRGERYLGDREKEVLRNQLFKQAGFCGIEILTYCLMSNHIHLLVHVPFVEDNKINDEELKRRYQILYQDYTPTNTLTPQELENVLAAGGPQADETRRQLKSRMGDVSIFMKELKQRFSRWYNHNQEFQGFGTVWAERFKSILVEIRPAVMSKIAAYIDLNPVRAGLVDDPGDYRWCGYSEMLLQTKTSLRGLQLIMGKDDERESLARYRMILFAAGEIPKKEGGIQIDREKVKSVLRSNGKVSLAEILRCRIRYFTFGGIIGSQEFIEEQFKKNRHFFGQNRQSGGNPMSGSDWDGIYSLRDIKKAPFS